MHKDMTYKEKFELLGAWGLEVLQDVKKDLKQEHFRKDVAFVQKHFAKRPVHKLTTEEILSAYASELKEGNEEIGEWIASRWVLKNAEVYNFFAQELTKINPNFDEIDSFSADVEQNLTQHAVLQFGALTTYLFSILTSVVFSESVYAQLRKLAEQQIAATQVQTAPKEESLEMVQKRYETAIAKLTEKYEQKLQGFHKKYSQDVEGLQKQVGQLQRRLSELKK